MLNLLGQIGPAQPIQWLDQILSLSTAHVQPMVRWWEPFKIRVQKLLYLWVAIVHWNDTMNWDLRSWFEPVVQGAWFFERSGKAGTLIFSAMVLSWEASVCFIWKSCRRFFYLLTKEIHFSGKRTLLAKPVVRKFIFFGPFISGSILLFYMLKYH